MDEGGGVAGGQQQQAGGVGGPLEEMLGPVRVQLLEWDGLVKSLQAPSRVLQWAGRAEEGGP